MFKSLTFALMAVLKEEMPLWEELYRYFKDKYFSGDLGRYDNFSFGTGSLITYNAIVIGLCVGIIIAAIASIYNKRYLGRLVRKIISEGANSPESAKTLGELGFSSSLGIKMSLTGGHTFGRIIKCVEAGKYYVEMLGEDPFAPAKPATEATVADESAESEAPEADETPKKEVSSIRPYKINLESDHFYIADEDKYRADTRFEKKGTNWMVFGVVVIGSILLAALAIFLIPEMLQFLDNFLTAIKK